MRRSAWDHFERVVRPALHAAPAGFLDDVATGLAAFGIQDAVSRHSSAPIVDWLLRLVALQGISDAVAIGFDARHGGITTAAVEAALAAQPSCPRLASYWHFSGCRFRRGANTCAEPIHRPRCPLPQHRLRKGLLNQAAFSLALFVRDIAGGDLVGWLDARLADADPGRAAPDHAAAMRTAVLEPLRHVHGLGPNLWSMVLADLLLAGDPGRERWVTTGASMVAIDSLVHAFLHRTGSLWRLGAEHPYGVGCYGPNGCARIIEGLAELIDARAFNPAFPARFPRFVEHAIWRFCAERGDDVCNGNQIDDRRRCDQTLRCPAFAVCDRLSFTTSAAANQPARRHPGRQPTDQRRANRRSGRPA